MDVALEKVRPCGRWETYSTARHHLGFYNNVGLTATYQAPSISETPIQNLVFAALHHVIAEHPNLSMIPTHEAKSYPDVYFARLPKIDLNNCVEFKTYDTSTEYEAETMLNQLLQSQHSRNFTSSVPNSPYWRLVITTFRHDRAQFVASWIFHHALCDGSSSMLFHESFFEGLNEISRIPPKTADSIVVSPSTPPTQPLEDLHSMPMSWSFFMNAVAGALLPEYLKSTSRGLRTGTPISQKPTPPNIRIVTLSAATTRGFATFCREQKSSVTAVLSTLLAVAIFETMELHYDEINIDMPISLRSLLDVRETQMVNAITNHTSTFRRSELRDNVDDGPNWNIARRVKSELTREVGKKGADSPIALLKYVSNMPNYFNEMIGKARASTGEVSNLGVHSVPTIGSSKLEGELDAWTVGRMIFSQSSNHTGSLISLSAVTGGDGCLVLCFNWPQDPVEASDGGMQRLDAIPKIVEHGILGCVRGSHRE